MLLSYSRLREDGFRLVDKPGDEDNIFLLSPTHPVDGKKYRIKLGLKRHGILTVESVVGIEAGLRESPSLLQNTSVYTLVTAGSGAPVKEATENLRPADRQRPKQTFRGICALPGPPGRAEARMAEAFFLGGSAKRLAQRFVSGAWPCRMY
jgi:hypothetical protein